MKIAILWTHLSGYLNVCLKELSKINDVQLFVSNFVAKNDAPFKNEQFSWFIDHQEWQDRVDKLLLENALSEFKPDVILVAGWHI